MSCTEFDRYIKKLFDYAERFIGFSKEQDANIRIKRDHSLKVLDEARHIAGTLLIETNLFRAVELAALFHDVGRFVQFQRYGTFNDRISANHARLSVQVLQKENILADCLPADYRIIIGSVLLHNRRSLPGHLRPDVDLVTRVIRDADKLDIMRVVLPHFEMPCNDAVTLGLNKDPLSYNPGIFANVQSKKTAMYEQMIWVNDFKLLVASWTYNMNFPVSRRTILSRGYLDRLFKCLPQEPQFSTLKEQLINDLSSG